MRTPVKTIMLMTKRVTTEIAALRNRNSNTCAAAGYRISSRMYP
jgi:hypothetical protein